MTPITTAPEIDPPSSAIGTRSVSPRRSSERSSGSGSVPPSDPSPSVSGGVGEKRPAPPPPSSSSLEDRGDRAKRPAGADPGAPGNPPAGSSSPSSPVLDVCESVGLKPGDRIEVSWDIHIHEEEEGEADDGAANAPASASASASAPAKDGGKPEGGTSAEDADDGAASEDREGAEGDEKVMHHWWGATLLLHDGRTKVLSDEEGSDDDAAGAPVPAALRVLDYDPYAEGGFPDRSLEEVVFLSDRRILNVSSGSRAFWRREGDDWTPCQETIPLPNPEENLRTILDNVLCSALEKTSGAARMKSMSAAQRAVVAEKIARAKEALLENMMALSEGESGRVITPDDVQRCMAEMGQHM